MTLRQEEATALSEAIQRFVRAQAPLTAGFLQHLKSTQPESDLAKMSAEELLKNEVRTLVARFVSVDGEIGGTEAIPFGQLLDMPDLGASLQVMGGTRGGKFFELTEQLGASAEAKAVSNTRSLLLWKGDDAAQEFAAATLELARTVCDLDGRGPEEESALEQLEAALATALASES